jgi:hypothetical protein
LPGCGQRQHRGQDARSCAASCAGDADDQAGGSGGFGGCGEYVDQERLGVRQHCDLLGSEFYGRAERFFSVIAGDQDDTGASGHSSAE